VEVGNPLVMAFTGEITRKMNSIHHRRRMKQTKVWCHPRLKGMPEVTNLRTSIKDLQITCLTERVRIHYAYHSLDLGAVFGTSQHDPSNPNSKFSSI
jgi:hypothetical protein